MTQPQRAYLLTQRRPEPSHQELQTAEHAFSLACSRLSEAGTPIQLLATSYVSAQQRWLSLCLADTAHDVLRAAATAQLTSVDVAEV